MDPLFFFKRDQVLQESPGIVHDGLIFNKSGG